MPSLTAHDTVRAALAAAKTAAQSASPTPPVVACQTAHKLTTATIDLGWPDPAVPAVTQLAVFLAAELPRLSGGRKVKRLCLAVAATTGEGSEELLVVCAGRDGSLLLGEVPVRRDEDGVRFGRPVASRDPAAQEMARALRHALGVTGAPAGFAAVRDAALTEADERIRALTHPKEMMRPFAVLAGAQGPRVADLPRLFSLADDERALTQLADLVLANGDSELLSVVTHNDFGRAEGVQALTVHRFGDNEHSSGQVLRDPDTGRATLVGLASRHAHVPHESGVELLRNLLH